MGETSWVFLLVGTFAAFGAAMALGTLAALLRYHRTGVLPGAEETADLSSGRYLALWVRVGVGIVLGIVGIIALDRAGIL